MQVKTTYKSWKSLGLIISFPFGILLIGSFLLFNILAFYSVKHSIFVLIDQLTRKTSEQIKTDLKIYFEKPILVNKINTDAFLYQEISRDALFKAPEHFFFKQHFQFPTVGDIFFGDKNGAICGVDLIDGKHIVKFTTDFPKREFHLLDEQGNRKKLIKTNTYSSLERDWFKKAISNKGPAWTGIYVFKNKNELGITASAPAYNQNGDFEGVMAVHLTLQRISDFLKQNKINQNTIVFMIEKSGHLVASSEEESLFKMKNNKPNRIFAIESKNDIIRSTMLEIYKQNINLNQFSEDKILKIDINEMNYFMQISNFKDKHGLDFLIITVVNENDFMQDIYKTLDITLIIAGLIIIILIIIGYFLSKRITKPIKILSAETQNIAMSGNLGKTISVHSDTFEIKLLIDTFNLMSQQLKISFDELNDLNKNLEHKVNERTQELQNTYQELANSQYTLLETHKKIKDSIQYGSLIQYSILPNEQTFQEIFSDYFILWQPKDSVGGDIYLLEKLSEYESILMVIDCTGHSVPGAFVTMLVKAIERQIINNIIYKKEEISPARILKLYNKIMKKLLNQENQNSESNVGFDGGILYINQKDNIAKYAGAKMPLYYMLNQELSVIKGDRSSVGYKKTDSNYEFTDHEIKLHKGMQFYLTTDGYLDQNGGKNDFPFGTKKFKELMMNLHQNTCEIQKNSLIHAIHQWKDHQEQNDDITIVSFKI